MPSNTVNRGWLRKQVELGNVEVKCDYSLTDDYAWDSASGFGRTEWMPARIQHPKFEDYINEYGDSRRRCVDPDRKDGYINLDEHDFKTKSGMAYRRHNDPNTIILSPYSNLSYSMRIVSSNKTQPKPEKKQEQATSILVGNTIIL